MANGLKDIIGQLERQRTAIERALAALREVDGTAAQVASAPVAVKTRGKRKGGMTAEGRARLSEALRQRWAAKRAAEGSPSAPSPKATAKKRGRPKKVK